MIYSLQTGPLGVNTYIVELSQCGDKAESAGGRSAFIVDPAACSFCGDESAITDFLREKNITPVAIVLTHGHFDHVSGLKHLCGCYPEIPVMIHKDDLSYIGAESASVQGPGLLVMGFADFIPSVTALPKATAFLEDGKTLRECLGALGSAPSFCGAEQWRVMHTPGHTRGSVCLYNIAEKLLLSGDTVFYHSWGRTDLPSGSESEMQESLKRIYSELPPETKVYPGHEKRGFALGENLG